MGAGGGQGLERDARVRGGRQVKERVQTCKNCPLHYYFVFSEASINCTLINLRSSKTVAQQIIAGLYLFITFLRTQICKPLTNNSSSKKSHNKDHRTILVQQKKSHLTKIGRAKKSCNRDH